MQIRIVTGQPWDARADVLVAPVVGDPDFSGPLGELDRRAGGGLSGLHAFGELRGKRFSTSLASGGELPASHVVTVSAGPADELDRETVRKVGATGIRRLIGRHAKTMAVWLDPLAGVDGGVAGAAELVARGVVEGGFEPKAIYREDTDAAPPALDELLLVSADGDAGALEKAAERGRIMGEGANIARRLANRSANDINPQVLADEASSIASQHGLWIDVIDEKRAKDMGMGMFLAVGQGSDSPPRMIVLRSGGEGDKDEAGRHLALIGKGVCFDSGGISIKPADRMEEMKMDKTGACTVIAAIATAARLAPGLPLLAVAPAVENMPSGKSSRPGDIIQALNGKFVDLINTDAEGRLILGDAMTYAERLGATHIVDVATLTGAVGRAIGNIVTGVFATPDSFWDDLSAASDRAGERYHRFPLIQDLMPEMDSWYADFQNTGTADGSLVKSGLFLEQFRTVPWAHLDIGGTAYFRKAYPYAARGATGVTHATMVEMALTGASKA